MNFVGSMGLRILVMSGSKLLLRERFLPNTVTMPSDLLQSSRSSMLVKLRYLTEGLLFATYLLLYC